MEHKSKSRRMSAYDTRKRVSR